MSWYQGKCCPTLILCKALSSITLVHIPISGSIFAIGACLPHSTTLALSFHTPSEWIVVWIRFHRMTCTPNLNHSCSKWASTKATLHPFSHGCSHLSHWIAPPMCIFGAWPVYPPHPVDCYIRFLGYRWCFWNVHLVDTNFFLVGVSRAIDIHISRGRFRWQAYCDAADADRIM